MSIRDGPLPDTLGAAVKKMLAKGKERGYVTYDELNEALPPDEVSSEQIEDTMAMLSEMGVNVVDNEESDNEQADADPKSDGKEAKAGASGNVDEDEIGPHRRSGAHVSARNGLGRIAVARGRNRHRQTHRGRPRNDDRRHLRKPADHPRHRRLARRPEADGEILLRDIIDLEATHGATFTADDDGEGEDGGDDDAEGDGTQGGDAKAAPKTAPKTGTPANDTKPAEKADGDGATRSDDDDDDDEEANLSLAALEAKLTPQVIETFEQITKTYKKLHKLQNFSGSKFCRPAISPRRGRKSATTSCATNWFRRWRRAPEQRPHRNADATICTA
jgi:RNA polymerase primary sigma factor